MTSDDMPVWPKMTLAQAKARMTKLVNAAPGWRLSNARDQEAVRIYLDDALASKPKSKPAPLPKHLLARNQLEAKAKRYAHSRARELAKSMRTPPWADRKAIALIYAEAAELSRSTGIPHEVDHIVPLRATTASGLHCEFNLRIITRAENRTKCNKHEIE